MKINIRKILFFKILTFLVFSQQFLLGMQEPPKCTKRKLALRLIEYPSIELNIRKQKALSKIIHSKENPGNTSDGEKQLKQTYPKLAQTLFETKQSFHVTKNDVEPYFWPYLYLVKLKRSTSNSPLKYSIKSFSDAVECALLPESNNAQFIHKILEIVQNNNETAKINKLIKTFHKSAQNKYLKKQTFFYPTEVAELINSFSSLNINGSNNAPQEPTHLLVNANHITGIDIGKGCLQGGHCLKNTQQIFKKPITKNSYASIVFDQHSLIINNQYQLQPCIGAWEEQRITSLSSGNETIDLQKIKIATIFPGVWEEEMIFNAIKNIYVQHANQKAFLHEQQPGKNVDIIGKYKGIPIQINIIKKHATFDNIDTVNTAYPVFIYNYDITNPQNFLNSLTPIQKTFIRNWFLMIRKKYNLKTTTNIDALKAFQRPKIFMSQQNNQNTISLFHVLGINLNLINYDENINNITDIGKNFLKQLMENKNEETSSFSSCTS